jgi:hypothetical protein
MSGKETQQYNAEQIKLLEKLRERSDKALQKRRFFGLLEGAVKLEDERLEVTNEQRKEARREMQLEAIIRAQCEVRRLKKIILSSLD